jgi:AraC family transcriptional regulator
MLRYLQHGVRDFVKHPDLRVRRLNWEFFARLSGDCWPSFSDRAKRPEAAEALNFWVIPPEVPYRWMSAGGVVRRVVLQFSAVPDLLAESMPADGHLARALGPTELAEIERVADELEPHMREPDQFTGLRCERAVLDLTLLALNDRPRQVQQTLPRIGQERYERATAWYSAHLKARPTVQQVADAVHVSPSQLRRHFEEAAAASPKQIFTKLRLQKACEYLATTSMTLDEVASHCGFHGATDFCRVFARTHHTTPNHWRRQINQRGPA